MVQTTDRSGRALVFGRGDNPINFVSVRDVGTLVERVFADPGAYGAFPWLDLGRGYAAFLVIESDAGVGAQLFTAVKPTLDAIFDSAGN